jgi:D-alanine-D-alanine ligase
MALLTTKRIAVLLGGQSAEREISTRSGQAVWAALLQKGYNAIPLDVDQSVGSRLREVQAEMAFIALHGPGGEDGTIQGMLEILRMPYTGSGVQACAMAMDKVVTKALLEYHKIPVPRGLVRTRRERRVPLPREFGFPVVVKPINQGSTLGISIVRQSRDLAGAIELALTYGPTALIEEYIDGRELTVGVVNDRPLPAVEIEAPNGFYDYTAKYTPGASVYKAPAPIPQRTAKLLQSLALEVHQRLGCQGATRVDFRMDPHGRPFVLEINTVPGMTETSLLPMAARAAKLSYESLVEAILQSAIERADVFEKERVLRGKVYSEGEKAASHGRKSLF